MIPRDVTPPERLIDPTGEGLYLLDDLYWEDEHTFPSVLTKAALALELYTDDGWPDFRAVDYETVYFQWQDNGDLDGEWIPTSPGNRPRGWRLNLPKRMRPVLYAYCTPKADS